MLGNLDPKEPKGTVYRLYAGCMLAVYRQLLLLFIRAQLLFNNCWAKEISVSYLALKKHKTFLPISIDHCNALWQKWEQKLVRQNYKKERRQTREEKVGYRNSILKLIGGKKIIKPPNRFIELNWIYFNGFFPLIKMYFKYNYIAFLLLMAYVVY